MARRWWARGIIWTGVGLAALVGVLLLALVLVTQSAYGRERVRQVAVRVASRYLLGSLHLGALRFGPGCALAIDSLAMRDPDDSLLVAVGPARATCQFSALVHGRLIITSLKAARPYVIVRQSPTGVWNWSRAIRPDTAPAPPSTGAARVVVGGPVRVTGGAIILDVPWTPPDSLRGAARDSAIDVALAARAPTVRKIGGALVRHREVNAITIDAPLVRTEIGDTTATVRLDGCSLALSDPPIVVHRITGRIAIVGESAELDLPIVAFGQSAARATGRIDWSAAGAPAIDARLAADTLAFGDVAWVAPNVPSTGGGRFELAIRSGGGTAPTDYAVTSAELRTTRSMVRGGVTVRLDSSGSPSIRHASLDLAPMHTDLLRLLAGGTVPADVRGALAARIVARGGPRGRLHIDTLEAAYADETGSGGTSRIAARGDITLGGGAGASFARLVLTAHAIDARTIVRMVPALAPLSGQLSGTVTLDSTLQNLRATHADLRYAEGNASPLRVTGSGRIDLGDALAFDLKLDARPLSPAAIARSYPVLATLPSFEGPIEIRGTPSDVSLAAGLHGVAGSYAITGRYREAASGVAIRATARLRDVDPRSASGRPPVPAGKLDADIDVDLGGDSLSALRGTMALSNLTGTVAGIGVEPSSARLSLTDSRIVAESVLVVTSAGVVSADGALGLRRSIRDTLHVNASVSLAELGPVLRAVSVPDSAARHTGPADTAAVMDSANGHVTARARIVGSLDSLDVDAEADGSQLAVPSVRASRAHVTATILGLPSAPRGRASLRADSVTAGGSHLSAFTASALSDDGERWRVALGTGTADRPGGNVSGAVSVRADIVDIELDSLAIRVPGTDLRLVRPTRLQRDASGAIVLDTLELRGARGALLRLVGVFRDTGAIAASLQLNDAPVLIPGRGGPGDSVRARLDAYASVEGTARAPHGTVRARVQLMAADSIPIDSIVADVAYAEGRTRITAGAHYGARSLFTARAAVPVHLSLAPFKAELPDDPISGEVSIDSLYLPDVTRLLSGVHASAGVLHTRLALSGTARHPRAVGNASLRGGAARIAALGLDVREANATLDLTTERITVREASVRGGEAPEGRAELAGFIGLADSATIDLRVRSAAMPVIRMPETAELDVSTDLRLVGPNTRPTLSGRITVDRGVIRLPNMGRAGVVGVDDTAFVRLVDSLTRARVGRAAGPSPLQRLDVGNVDVVMGPNVWLRSAEASVQLGGSVGLERAAPQPSAADGRVALRGALVTERGNYRLNLGAISRSFELEQGSVQFTGEPELNPRLDINAIYTREGTDDVQGSGRVPRVRAHLGGTLDRPKLTLSSDDSLLSQAELMSYLVTGQASFALGDIDEQVLAGELVASATGALAQRLAGGFFDVVNVTAGTTTDDRDEGRGASAASAFAASRLGIGKQVSNRLFLNVDAGLCALTGGGASTDLWQTLGVSLDYRLRRDLLGSLNSAPSTNGAACANQAASRGSAVTPRQWGLDFDRLWRF